MGVIRVPHHDNFTTMANCHLRDNNLSLRAVGLMSKMLSLPDDWDYTVAGLASICKEGREAVRKVLQELEAAGYLEREQSREGGHFAGYDYTLHEDPKEILPDRCPETWATAEPPLPKNPLPRNPLPENPPQINTNKPKTKKQKQASAPFWQPEMFERFWKAYPCGKDKAGARREWDKLKPDRELMLVMSAALDRAKASDEWQRGIGIPYACRWLRNRRWEDEPDHELQEFNTDASPERKLAGERC